MKRRPDESIDPLDLFLDTVCNLFAVIIFIAIFAAVLVKPGTRAQDAVSVNNQIQGDSQSDSFNPPIIELIEIESPEIAEIDEQIVGAEQELEARSRMRRRLEAAIKQARGRDRSESGTLASMQAEVESLEARVEATQSISSVPMRTPRKGEQAEAIPAALYVHAGKVYIANDYRGWGNEQEPESNWWKYMGPTRFADDMVVRSSSSATRQRDGTVRRRLRLRPDGGLALKDPIALRNDPEWRDQIGGLLPGSHIVYITVTPDSFAEFGVVRSELTRLGISYDVFISVNDSPVIDETWVVGTPTTQ